MKERETETSPGAANGTVTLPLFPLNTVLFPGGPLPLRIFEARYMDMVRRCMRQRSSFGVVMIRSGGEVGEVTDTADVGTTARIVDFYTLPDGLLGITCIGERRFRVLRRWRESNHLNMGELEWLQAEPSAQVPPEFAHLADILRSVLPQLGELYRSVPRHFEDAAWVSARIAEILPLDQIDKQSCLELDDPLLRLARIAPLIRRADD